MSKTFNIESAVGAESFEFKGNQAKRAAENGVERVFVWPRDLRGNERRLPNYVLAACEAAGYAPVVIGGTTYSHSVVGLRRVQAG